MLGLNAEYVKGSLEWQPISEQHALSVLLRNVVLSLALPNPNPNSKQER